MARRCWGLLLLAAAAGCSGAGGGHPVGPPKPPAAPLAEEVARLTVPPGADSAGALDRLGARAEAGDQAAAWERVHYLIDLFDDARFRRDAGGASLGLLAHAMGAPDDSVPARGATATDEALAFLLVEDDAILARDRLHGPAQQARTLLELDVHPPARRGEVLQRVIEVKAVARGGGPLADNARLRLFGFCRQAFADAAAAPPASRMTVLSFCLYPLYDSDPEPYFAADPRRRPPPPRWQDLGEALTALVGKAADGEGRLAAAAGLEREELARFLAARAAALPEAHPPAALGVPMVAEAAPWDFTPLLALGDGARLDTLEAYVARLTGPVSTDGRGAVAVALAASAPGEALLRAAAAAAGAGAGVLELAVGYRQQLTVPAGDYWSGRVPADGAPRLGVLPVALAPLGGRGGGAAVGATVTPRGMAWDPRRAALGLHLAVGAGRWRLIAATGEVAAIDAAADPAAALREALGRVRGAFAEEDGLVVVVEPGATYGAVVTAVEAAATDAEGRSLFGQLALGDAAPAAVKKSLPQRIERRWQARVAVNPEPLAPRAAAARACYQDLLEKSPTAGGTVRLELKAGKAVVAAAPPGPALRACALAALGRAMVESKAASAEVLFAPR